MKVSGRTLSVDLSSILILGSSWFTSTRKQHVGGLRDEKEGQSNREKQPYKGCGDRFGHHGAPLCPQDAVLSLALGTSSTLLVMGEHSSCNLRMACFTFPTWGAEILGEEGRQFLLLFPHGGV